MNNGKIFISKANGNAYYGRNNGVNLEQTVPNVNLSEYIKVGENELFYIYKPKTHE